MTNCYSTKDVTMQNRFQDQKYTLATFHDLVTVVCPECTKKAQATVDYANHIAKLYCSHCNLLRQESTMHTIIGMKVVREGNAAAYFDVELWYQAPFKKNIFIAYSEAHLAYLEQYIAAWLREHKDRTHFTLLEKLPRFYHEAKNREGLLKLIEKLRLK